MVFCLKFHVVTDASCLKARARFIGLLACQTVLTIMNIGPEMNAYGKTPDPLGADRLSLSAARPEFGQRWLDLVGLAPKST